MTKEQRTPVLSAGSLCDRNQGWAVEWCVLSILNRLFRDLLLNRQVGGWRSSYVMGQIPFLFRNQRPLEQYCPTELSETTEVFNICAVQYGGHYPPVAFEHLKCG